MNDLDIFTEQAEYISESSFEKWTVSYQEEEKTLKKLIQGGAKLIIGPRGCGKTTMMLRAFHKSLQNTRSSAVLPIYVNFKSSLKLEPLYRNNTNAAYWFNQWLLYKVIQGLHVTFSEVKKESVLLSFSSSQINKNLNLLEMGRVELFDDVEDQITITDIKKMISSSLKETSKARCILLLDDAGHAFSSEQQHDFFEFFREVKTKLISPKAALYPGVTSYSSSFHVGHDAEEIDVWIKPQSSNYLKFMHSLLYSRLPKDIYKKLIQDEALLNIICFSSYGIPRTLLNII